MARKRTEKKQTKRELDTVIKKEGSNFRCLLCDKVVTTSLPGLIYQQKKNHGKETKLERGVTYELTADVPKNEVPRKKRERKTTRKVTDEEGNTKEVAIIEVWEDTIEAEELYNKSHSAYLTELERRYPDHNFLLTEYEQEERFGILTGGEPVVV